MAKIKNLIGEKFGRLTVIERDYEKQKQLNSKETFWKCQCDCGNFKSIQSQNLKNGNTQSCGCLNSELVIKRNKKYNKYNLDKEYGIGYTLKDEEFYFDLEDYDKIKDYYWYIDNNGYVVSKQKDKIILMHRLIMNVSDDCLIDHIFAQTYDNRKSQLRYATKSQNCQNSKTPKNNTSGVKGVVYNKSYNSWGYEIWCNNKRERKYGITFDEAVKSRKEAEIRLHKEFRRNEDIL